MIIERSFLMANSELANGVSPELEATSKVIKMQLEK